MFKRILKRILTAPTINATNELIYQHIFTKKIESLGLTYRYAPVNAAANNSFLSILLSMVDAFELKNILELGCGQTTLLFDDLRTKKNFHIDTVENHPLWKDTIQEMVKHEITLCPLTKQDIAGHTANAYTWPEEIKNKKYDLIVIDGPVGGSKMSRHGALELIPNSLEDEFIMVFDDAERKGEQETIAAARTLLKHKGVTVHEKTVRALKNQHIFFTDKYSKVFMF